MRFAERNILDAHPEAEALLIDQIFDLEGADHNKYKIKLK